MSARSAEQLEPPSVLTVENQRTEAATIYVQHAGVRTQRLGRVESLSSANFVLDESAGAPGSDLQLAAVGFANSWVDVSDPIPLARRTRYRWQLAPTRNQQFLSSQRYAAADGTAAPSHYTGDRLHGNRGTR